MNKLTWIVCTIQQTLETEEPEITLPGKMWKRLRLNQRNKWAEAEGLENEMRWGGVEARRGEEMVLGSRRGEEWLKKGEFIGGWPCEKELIKVTFVGDAWGSEASFGTCVCGAKLTVNTNNQSAGPIEHWRQWNEGERLAHFSLRSCGVLVAS